MNELPNKLQVRVYYEDTDFSGRVYHASYFRFFERGRTEWLRALGLEHNRLAETAGVAFAVRRLETEFFAPAFIDDLLEVTTHLQTSKGPILNFRQIVRRGEIALASCSVEIVSIKGNHPVRPPREIRAALAAASRQ